MTILPIVQRMIDNPGVYITSDSNHETATIVMLSFGGKIYVMSVDDELRPDGFLDTFVVRHGPLG